MMGGERVGADRCGGDGDYDYWAPEQKGRKSDTSYTNFCKTG